MHACAAIQKSRNDLNLFVDNYFHTQTYRFAYDEQIFPIPPVGLQKPIVAEAAIYHPMVIQPPGRLKKKKDLVKRGDHTADKIWVMWSD